MVLDILSRRHTNPKKKNTRKPWKWIVTDSVIIGSIAAWACAPQWFPTTLNEVWVMGKAFGAAFFLQAAVELGLKRK